MNSICSWTDVLSKSGRQKLLKKSGQTSGKLVHLFAKNGAINHLTTYPSTLNGAARSHCSVVKELLPLKKRQINQGLSLVSSSYTSCKL
uniref:Uncharacterized protein n=1 Tax=Oryza brachyantha TaxID=4533 RepID=J3N7K2_ORYBR